jgi:hypothetical protein
MGLRAFSFLFWVMDDCEAPKVVLFFLLTWVSHMERTLEANCGIKLHLKSIGWMRFNLMDEKLHRMMIGENNF